ncbi:MAG TPA: TRIC cation channel family protein [Candidatus Baltobacteraceae bacterium]|jgi:uncharacterized membrane protein YeiH
MDLVVAFVISRRIALKASTITIPDAIGLGVFSSAGTQIAADMHTPILISIVMGVITGSVGGVLRDIICNEVPSVFVRTQLYATCAALGSGIYLIAQTIGADNQSALTAGAVSTIALRLAAVRFNITLPA